MLRPSFKLSVATVLLLSPLATACSGCGSTADDSTSDGSGGADVGVTGADDAGTKGGSAGAGVEAFQEIKRIAKELRSEQKAWKQSQSS